MSNTKPIAIDCRFAGINTGIGRYTRELVSEMLKIESQQCWILYVRSKDEDWLKNISNTNIEIISAPYKHYSWGEQNHFPDLLSGSPARLLFSPHFNVPYFCPLPFVITIHDLILHKYPNKASIWKRIAYRLLLSRAINKSKHIITVSETTHDDLCDIYSHWKVESKSSVISEGVNDNFYRRSVNEIENVKRRYGLHKPFFLYVGNAKEHKNVQTLIDAFQSLGDNSIDLVLITSGPETAFLNFQQGIKFIPDIPDSDLPALYSGAKAFVTASLYEGFCLPVAEAISCGCPVIASNKGAIPEIAGEDSVLVEPIAVELSKAMKNPPDPTDEVIHNKFSWNQAARDTINLLINI